MENLLVYVIELLIRFGKIEKNDFKICGEDCWSVYLDNRYMWVFSRPELIELRGIIHNRLAYMSDEEIAVWNRLLSQLDVQ